MSQDYFSKHLSLSEWAIQANITGKQALIDEDGSKRQRLRFLSDTIGLPIVRASSFTYKELSDHSKAFIDFKEAARSLPYAVRANPKIAGLPVQRNRKLPVAELVKWLASTGIDGDQYELSFEPHIDPELAAIFIVTDERIVGEAVEGGILQLNKGSHASGEPVQFEYDFATWHYTRPSVQIDDFLHRAIKYLKVERPDEREVVEGKMGLGFSQGYLKGYFEVIWSSDSGTIFIDYNRELIRTADRLRVPRPKLEQQSTPSTTILGQSGCAGTARGLAQVVQETDPGDIVFAEGQILVCRFTSPDFVPLMMKAAGVVTDVGGILSHAAIVCRELRKPCVVGTKSGTEKIHTGESVEVDGDGGLVRIL